MMGHPSLQEIRDAAEAVQELLGAVEHRWYDNFEVTYILKDVGVNEAEVRVDAEFISLMSPKVVLSLLDLITVLGRGKDWQARAVGLAIEQGTLVIEDSAAGVSVDVLLGADDSTRDSVRVLGTSDHHHYIENTAEAMREALDA